MLTLIIAPALGTMDISSSSLAGSLTVTKVTVEPSVLMRGDTAIVTVTVTNTGDSSVLIREAELFSKELTILSDQIYVSTMTIGPGNSMDLTFTVRADARDGIYYAKLYLNLENDSVRYYIPLKIDSTPIDIFILSRPDTFSEGAKDEITLVVGNPRENTLSGVIITPSGEGIKTTQTAIFVGDLDPGKKAEVTFEVTASEEGELSFLVEYRNGINKHAATITIPVQFGSNKLAAKLMMNNIEFFSSGTTYTLSADVTNAGLSDANSIVVTVESPAQPTDPNPVYIVGTLEPDDFSSFELTFTIAPGILSIPVIVQYKDADGNDFEEQYSVNLRGGVSNSTASSVSGGTAYNPGTSEGFRNTARGGLFGMGNGFGQIPFLMIGLILVVVIGLAIAWRKGYLSKIKERLRR
jgi:hypothetical protein